MGLLVGINAALLLAGKTPPPPPAGTALGALIHHLIASDPRHFQPSNVNFGLFPELSQQGKRKVPKKMRGQLRAEQALHLLRDWQEMLYAG